MLEVGVQWKKVWTVNCSNLYCKRSSQHHSTLKKVHSWLCPEIYGTKILVCPSRSKFQVLWVPVTPSARLNHAFIRCPISGAGHWCPTMAGHRKKRTWTKTSATTDVGWKMEALCPVSVGWIHQIWALHGSLWCFAFNQSIHKWVHFLHQNRKIHTPKYRRKHPQF